MNQVRKGNEEMKQVVYEGRYGSPSRGVNPGRHPKSLRWTDFGFTYLESFIILVTLKVNPEHMGAIAAHCIVAKFGKQKAKEASNSQPLEISTKRCCPTCEGWTVEVNLGRGSVVDGEQHAHSSVLI